MKTREFRERVLVALLLHTREHGASGYINIAQMAEQYGLPLQMPGQLRLVVKDLEARGFLKGSYEISGGIDGGMSCILTSAGLEAAEDLLDDHPEYGGPPFSPTEVPAADRYVALTDNQRADVQPVMAGLQRAIQASNEADDEDRMIALSEIAIIEAALIQPRVPVEAIDRFVHRVLGWIVKKFGDNLVGAVAGALIAKLLPFLAT